MTDAPKFLIEWSSPWEEFVTAIGPALGRSPKRLAGEARAGLFPYPGILLSWAVEGLLLAVLILLPAKLASMRPYTPPPMPKYDVIYFSGNELPQTEDLGGAQTGRTGRTGGHEARHRTQTIRVARGRSLSEKVVDAPKLNLPRSEAAVANLLAVKAIPGPAPAEGLKSSLPTRLPQMSVVPPPPDVARDKLRAVPNVNGIVAPPPEVDRSRMRVAPALSTPVIPPAATDVQRQLATAAPTPLGSVEVVPPPVSAPARDTNVNAKLLLPAQSVIAPPPDQVVHEVGSLNGSVMPDVRKGVVPPPVQAGTRPLDKQGVGSLIGSPAVVPPPVQAGTRSLAGQAGGGLVNAKDVVAPPVDGSLRSLPSQMVAGLGKLGGSNNVVPPPPTVGGGTSPLGRGRGDKGGGLGGPLDIGSAVAPPGASGGSSNGSGVVISNNPGTNVGVPGKGAPGALAMSPSGGDKPGLGGSSGGAGIGRGNGPGSGLSGEGTGAGKEGSGRGSDTMAKGGISPYPGAGGAGSGARGTPASPGVSVRGGNTITLPSFGTGAGDPSAPERSSVGKAHRGLDITVEGSSRSGGGFNFYGLLRGDKVYTIYIPTSAGHAVMQYADPSSAAHVYGENLISPEAMRADLPPGLGKSRLVIACILDRSGALRNVQVLEKGTPEMTAKVLAALRYWKFRPVLRGTEPIEVNAILGFNIDTN